MCCFIFSIPQIVAAQDEEAEEKPIKPIILKKMPDVNTAFPVKKRDIEKAHFLSMTASGGMKPAFYTEFKGIRFDVAVASFKSNIISYISTTDTAFKTKEDVMVGDTFEDVLKKAKGEVVKEQGWAFWVRLNSGWNAAFMENLLTEDEAPPPDAKVSFLFKRYSPPAKFPKGLIKLKFH